MKQWKHGGTWLSRVLSEIQLYLVSVLVFGPSLVSSVREGLSSRPLFDFLVVASSSSSCLKFEVQMNKENKEEPLVATNRSSR